MKSVTSDFHKLPTGEAAAKCHRLSTVLTRCTLPRLRAGRTVATAPLKCSWVAAGNYSGSLLGHLLHWRYPEFEDAFRAL